MPVTDPGGGLIPWLVALHVSALVFWCGALLYLPTLIAGTRAGEPLFESSRGLSIMRRAFIAVATPAALLAITAGTAIFILDRTLEIWLILKLVLVTILVVCHILIGLMIIEAEDTTSSKSLTWPCRALSFVQILLIPAIFWLVLAKPFGMN